MKNKKVLILAVVGVLVLGAGGAAAFFALRGGGAGTEAVERTEPPGVLSLEPFLVNVYHQNGDRHAKVEIELAISPASAVDDVTEDALFRAKVRDRVLTLLSSKSYDELRTPVGKEAFRREVQALLGPLLDDAQIQEVLFSDFVVQ